MFIRESITDPLVAGFDKVNLMEASVDGKGSFTRGKIEETFSYTKIRQDGDAIRSFMRLQVMECVVDGIDVPPNVMQFCSSKWKSVIVPLTNMHQW